MIDAGSGRRRAEPAPHHSIDEILAVSRRGVERIAPGDLPALQEQGRR